jgi:hypothetical protein
MECAICHKEKDEDKLTKCPLCHQFACEECKHVQQGRGFCSRYCAESFFFSEEEEGED